MSGCDGRSGGCKGLGSTAVGFWGRDIYRRIAAEQVQARERALLQDSLKGMGLKAALYQGVTEGNLCRCYNKANKQADRKCFSCYGTGYVPGYLKFGYNTVWMSPVDDDLTLTNTEKVTTFQANLIQLKNGETEGYIESGDKSFNRTAIGSNWAYDFKFDQRSPDNSEVELTYSLDSGSTWSDISNLTTENPTSGTIRFRVKLTRDSSSVFSPFFEIVRARYERIDINNNTRTGPWILITNDKPYRRVIKSEHGDIPLQDNISFWTAGMSMFDPEVEVGSEDELLIGPNIVVEILEGVLAGNKYVTTSWLNDDPRGYMVVIQKFKMRFGDPVGPYSLIW